MCGAAASATLQLETCSGDCRSAEYCCGRDCQARHRVEHEEQCGKTKADRIDAVLDETGHESLYWAAAAGDVAAVRALICAGADVEEGVLEADTEFTPLLGAAFYGRLDVVVYLVEEASADLNHRAPDGCVAINIAAMGDHDGQLDVLRYLAKKTPQLVDVPDEVGFSPIMSAACRGHTELVRHLARLGCSISRINSYGLTALSEARDEGHHGTVRLLEDIESAGGWRPYAAARRMAYVRIRHEVSKTYLVLDEDDKRRELYHFLFGKNEVLVSSASEPRRTRARDRRLSLLTLPDAVFSLVCLYLES